MRRIARTPDFEMSLQLRQDSFIAPPRDSQRNWLVAKAIAEFGRDLRALDTAATTFVPGSDAGHDQIDRLNDALTDAQIMEDWQIPLMIAMAEAVTHNQGDVLEIGFGRGVASTLIQQHRPRRHTIIECNDAIVERYRGWRAQHADAEIELAHGLWQDVLDNLGLFDGIFFHTYPLNEDEFIDLISRSVTFAEHFFADAARHLKPGGIFAYPSFEIDSLSRAHQRALLAHFSSVQIGLQPLDVPADVHDGWWSQSMVLVRAIK